jgi:hypothetical protein
VREKRLWWLAPFAGSAIAILVLLASMVGMMYWAMRPLGEAIGKSMEGLFTGLFTDLEAWFRVLALDPADLEVAPGSAGYQDSLHADGPQYHYFAKGSNTTLIAIGLGTGEKRLRWPLARYNGPPSRDILPAQLTATRLPLCLVLVRVVDAEGRSREHAGVSWKRGDGEVGWSRNSGRDGEVDLFLIPGTYAIGLEGEGEPRHAITLAEGEAVLCTLGPAGLTVEQRVR